MVLTLILDGSGTGPTEFARIKIRYLPIWTDQPRPPKSQVKAGHVVQENTRQYHEAKEANVILFVLCIQLMFTRQISLT